MLLAAAMAPDQDAFVTGLAEHNLPLAGRCAAQPERKVSDEAIDRLRWALVDRSRDPAADLRARIAAGEALGELGDPRFKRCKSAEGVAYLLPPMVRVPGGRYWIGSDEGSYPDVLPRQEVEVETFWIGQFPVTNAEYACFIAARGYEDPRWWVGEAAQRWWRGEGTDDASRARDRQWRQRFLQEPELLDRMKAEGTVTAELHKEWTKIARLDDAAFGHLLSQKYKDGPKRRPDRWNRLTPADGNRPVIGASWFEAAAYAAWLAATADKVFQVTHEVEWELAATGPNGWRYPFGEDFRPEACNNASLHLGRPAPVGSFSQGDAPCGASDLCGNVLEWTNQYPGVFPIALGNMPALDGNAVKKHSGADPLVQIKRNREWQAAGADLRANLRRSFLAAHRAIDTGFRLTTPITTLKEEPRV